MTTFDPVAAEEAKAEGTRGTLRAHPEWTAKAEQQVEEFVREGRTFCADDVVAAVGLPEECTQNANNVVGALFNSMGKRKIIEPTGDRVKSARVEGHARKIDVWQGYTGREVRRASALDVLDRWFVIDHDGARFATDRTKAERQPRQFFAEMRRALEID